MNYTSGIVSLFEIVGTVAFASSGAMVGIRRQMDIFGVLVLGVITATGGGVIRDLILGLTPPVVFQNYIYVVCASLVSALLFLIVYLKGHLLEKEFIIKFEQIMMGFDAIGLGIFTVSGMNRALILTQEKNYFLVIFVGVITGIGGGMLRDVLAGMTPFVFVKHIYASASILGAVCYLFLYQRVEQVLAMCISALVIVVIRGLAAHYRWNLPRIKNHMDL